MLANNQGNFRIAFFSLGDDEVDYSIIEKFGRAVGKEKIAKNTPIFEAQTQGSIAMKTRLMTLASPTIVRLPTLSLEGSQGLVGNLVTLSKNDPTTRLMTVTQQIEGEVRIPDGLSDVTFTVELPNRFLTLQSRSSVTVDPLSQIATYFVTRQGNTTDSNGAIANFTLQLQPGLDNTIFSIYGNSGDKSKISAVASVIGDQSGIRKDFSIQINQT